MNHDRAQNEIRLALSRLERRELQKALLIDNLLPPFFFVAFAIFLWANASVLLHYIVSLSIISIVFCDVITIAKSLGTKFTDAGIEQQFLGTNRILWNDVDGMILRRSNVVLTSSGDATIGFNFDMHKNGAATYRELSEVFSSRAKTVAVNWIESIFGGLLLVEAAALVYLIPRHSHESIGIAFIVGVFGLDRIARVIGRKVITKTPEN